MTHQVYVHRVGPSAILKCDVCAGEQKLVEDGFDELNEFIREHKRCVPLDAGP